MKHKEIALKYAKKFMGKNYQNFTQATAALQICIEDAIMESNGIVGEIPEDADPDWAVDRVRSGDIEMTSYNK